MEASYRKLMETVEHVFTHFVLKLFVFTADVPKNAKAPAGCRWVGADVLDGEAFPSVMRKIIDAARRNGV